MVTIWNPSLEEDSPRYLAIADALARDLQLGRLRPGDQLPTHRQLARNLGVTVGTVSRGFAEAERRGLTVGEVGRGTFIRPTTAENPWLDHPRPHGSVIDLNHSLPVTLAEESSLLAAALSDLSREPECLSALLDYRSDTASRRQRAVAARWLSRLGLEVDAEHLLVTSGSQHGINVVLAAMFQPGQVILSEALTYPALKSQARAFGIRLRGVEMDDEGVLPEAVDRACGQDPKPAGLYLVPTLQNPTGAIMSEARRQDLADVAERHQLLIIEDDIHAQLPARPHKPLAAWAPARTIYLASVSKCLSPGLRTGFIVAPEQAFSRLLAGIHSTLWMAPPLMVEITTRWLDDGTADRLIAAKRRETESRQRLAHEILGAFGPQSHPSAYHLWLELPEPWCSDELVSLARERGVAVAGAGAFAIGRQRVPHAFRLSVGVAPRPDLEKGLSILAEILGGGATASY